MLLPPGVVAEGIGLGQKPLGRKFRVSLIVQIQTSGELFVCGNEFLLAVFFEQREKLFLVVWKEHDAATVHLAECAEQQRNGVGLRWNAVLSIIRTDRINLYLVRR